MALISIWNSNPEALLNFTVEQIVATSGNGKLSDGSECSDEFRMYLSQVSSDKLAEYADYCLTTKFEYGGRVLQDVVNEFGRRLDYDVTNGRYQGIRNAVGNDGLWLSPEGHHLLVEVKTTDAYSMSVDTVAAYRNALLDQGDIGSDNSMLLVVGRYDTGQLEAQVRGSRHAWDMRLISIDSLVNLVRLKENTEDEVTATKIRSILVPMEYTRLDRLVDVMFTTAKDVESVSDTIATRQPDDAEVENHKGVWEFTESALIDERRKLILQKVGELKNVKLIKRSRALYRSSDNEVAVACTVSKRYEGKYHPYWYSYHDTWQEFLRKSTSGYFALGCMDADIAFVLPVDVIDSTLGGMNSTTKNGKVYWQVQLQEQPDGNFVLTCPKTGDHLNLQPYKVTGLGG